MTTDEAFEAGAAAVAGWPPLSEQTRDQLALILAPLAEQPEAEARPTTVRPRRRKAA